MELQWLHKRKTPPLHHYHLLNYDVLARSHIPYMVRLTKPRLWLKWGAGGSSDQQWSYNLEKSTSVTEGSGVWTCLLPCLEI